MRGLKNFQVFFCLFAEATAEAIREVFVGTLVGVRVAAKRRYTPNPVAKKGYSRKGH